MESDSSSSDEFINELLQNSAIDSVRQLGSITNLASSSSSFSEIGWNLGDETNIGRKDRHYNDRIILKKYNKANPRRFKRLFR